MRRGITLLELLVVMLILLMVTAAAIPIIAPAMQNRQMRESTRLVTAFLGAAKARAVQLGRPVGIVIERENGQAFAFRMAQVEVPPPYSGDIVGSKATVAITNPGPTAGEQPNTPASKTTFDQLFNQLGHTMSAVWFRVGINAAEFNATLVHVGDQIQFGNQGYVYTIFGPDANGDNVIDAGQPLDIAYAYPDDLDYTASTTPARPLIDNVAFPWANTTVTPQAVTYQIFRHPVRTSSPPLQLPEGIVFDLSLSGGRMMPFNTQNYLIPIGTLPVPAPLVRFDPQIIFSPSGRVEWVTSNAGQLVRLTDPIFLLLGRRELMFDATSRGDARDIVFQNISPVPAPPDQRPVPAENYWIVVSDNGQVSTAQVAPNFQDYTNSTGAYTYWIEVAATAAGQSMAYALEQQTISGR